MMLCKKSGTRSDSWTSSASRLQRRISSCGADYVIVNVLPYLLPTSLLHDDGNETMVSSANSVM
jgi:hypothetical protein